MTFVLAYNSEKWYLFEFFTVPKVFTAQILSVSQNPAVPFFLNKDSFKFG